MSKKTMGSVFTFEGRPGLRQSFPLALQHVVAMVVGCCTPAFLVANACELDAANSAVLIQASLLLACLATLLQLFPIAKLIGARLPMVMGVSFACVPAMLSTVEAYKDALAAPDIIGVILGAQLTGACVAVLFGLFVDKIRVLFPPMVAGTVVFSIGISLWPTAVKYMAGGAGAADFGSWQNWLVAFVTLAVVLGFTHFAKGLPKLAAILIGLAAGYIVAVCFGMVNFGNIASADIVALPAPLHFPLRFEGPVIASMAILYIVNSVQAIGDISATTSGAMDRMPTDRELRGGIVCNGATNIIGALFGGLPTATFSQNVGIVTTTKVVNRFVISLAAAVIGIAGLSPVVAQAFRSIPNAVIGGATITVFAPIAMTGVRLTFSQGFTPRNMAVVGIAVAMGVGITQSPGCFAGFPEWVQTIFGSNMVTTTTVLVILLNLIIPKDKAPEK